MKETAYSPTIDDLIEIKYWIATASYRDFPPDHYTSAHKWQRDCDWVEDRLNSAIRFLIELELASLHREPVEDPEITPEPALERDDRDERVYGDGVHKFGADY